MLPRNHPDRIRIVFDDHRLVANAGLLLPATLARHLGLRELVDHHLDLGGAPGRANTGDKLMTLVASAMAGGDCIDDADVLRTGGTACTPGGTVKAPSTLGTFLRSFRWGHVRQLDRVSRELPARAWQAGAGPGDGPLTIDLDSTICETYGLAKEGARHHGYTGKRGYHPLPAIAAGTGDVLMSRLREGRANTARGAAHFLRETVGRVRYAGANGRLTLRADSGFYTHGVVSVCRKMDVRFSITIRQHKSLAISSRRYPRMPGLPFPTGWTVPPMWPRPPALPSRVNLPGHQHVSGAGGDGRQRVVAPLAGIAVVAGALLGQSVGLADGGVQVNGQGPVAGSRPSGPSPGRQLAAHPVELTDMPPPEAAQEGAQGGWRLDRAARGAGRPPGAQHIGVVDAVAAGHG